MMGSGNHYAQAQVWRGDIKVMFTFKGVYDEDTGVLKGGSERTVQITAYFTSIAPETFTLNEIHWYGHAYQPLYFSINTSLNRQYWLSEGEYGGIIYVYDTTLSSFTIEFIDLAGVLGDYPIVTASRYVAGSLTVVEKRKVDIEKKIVMSLKQGEKYTVTIKNGAMYVFGDLLCVSSPITLTLKGIDFPQNVILAFKYVRFYADRHNNFTSISMLYEDLDENTDHVVCNIKFRNGTVAYTSTQYSNTFNTTWTSADYNTTYFVEMDSYHNDYGVLNYRVTMYKAGFGATPFNLEWLGSIPGMNIADLIPSFLIFGVALVFSKVNAYVAAFLACVVAILLTWLGFISIAPGLLMLGLFFSILMGLVAKKRMVVY